jgi:SAM-dependent methyltransferase
VTEPYAEMIATNRANWDARVPVHLNGGYDLDHLRRGGQRLADFEYAAVDVRDRDVLHLQCHIGTDSICLARHGARVTGLDLSGESVAAARTLAAECGADVEYVRGNVYEAVEALDGRRFDVVYTGKGALCWLPDLHRWAEVVARLLRPGGRLYLVEMHPLFQAAGDEQAGPELVLSYDYLNAGAEHSDRPYSYTGHGRLAAATENYQWAHGIDEILDAVLSAGLRLVGFVEHDVGNWGRWPWLVPLGDGWFGLPPGAPRLPLTYSVLAELPE